MKVHVTGMEETHDVAEKKRANQKHGRSRTKGRLETLSWPARYARSAILLPTAPKQFPSFIMDRALKRKSAKSIGMNAPRSVPKGR